MSWFYYKILLISLGITLGLFLAYQGYKYFLRGRKQVIYVPRIVLHSIERFVCAGEVMFHYEVREEQQIVFEICNAGFEPVLELLNQKMPDGSYTIVFDTKTLSNGEYFYRLRGEEQQVMKKIEIRN